MKNFGKNLGKRYADIKSNDKKGFTLIELVVVIAIMAILALIMVPNLTAWVQKADDSKIQANLKNVHTAAEMVRQTEGNLDEDRIKEFSNNQDVKVDEEATEENLEADKYTVTNKGGQTVVKYKTQDGKVFTFPDVSPNYVMAQDSDFSGTSNGEFKYIGSHEYVYIPHVIKGVNVTSYREMFSENTSTTLKGVASDNLNITSMSNMFRDSQATSLDLSSFDTSNVTNMERMFYDSQATSLDLSSFDTSNVTNMYAMFYSSQATTLDLSSFDTSSVTSMGYMFFSSKATTGYARTQADADRFNASSRKPAGLTFIVKP